MQSPSDTTNNVSNSWRDDSDIINVPENALVKTGYHNRRFLQETF